MSAPCAAVLMCHAPIVIPAIAGGRAEACRNTTEAMAEAARVLVRARPASVVILSPHAPRMDKAFSWRAGERWHGNFAAFGRPELRLTFESDLGAAEALQRVAPRYGVLVTPVGEGPSDHGALVPLWFLREAGYGGKVLVVGFPEHADQSRLGLFALALGEAMGSRPEPWALLASGDMSHSLAAGSPSGFDPRARDFDRAVVACLREGRPGEVGRIAGDLRKLAAEDVTESLVVSASLVGAEAPGHRVLSYQGPFGVGYLVAVLGVGA